MARSEARLQEAGLIPLVDPHDERTGAAIAEWVNGGKPVDHALELLRRAAFEAASGGTERFTKWWNAAPVRGRRKALRPDLDNLTSIARAADDEVARERQAGEAERQQRHDQALLDKPFGKIPIRGNGTVKPAAHGREPVMGVPA